MRTPIEEAVFAGESAKWRATPIITTVGALEELLECDCSGMCAALDHDKVGDISGRLRLHASGCPKASMLVVFAALRRVGVLP